MSRHLDPPQLIESILRNTGWNQEALANHLRVDQSTVSRWASGLAVPGESTTEILQALASICSEKSLLLGAGMMAAVPKWFFLCARAPSYAPTRVSRAEQTLSLLVEAIRAANQRRQGVDSLEGHCFLCSITAMAAPFVENAQAFIYGDDPDSPRRFLVLVNKNLAPQQQLQEVLAEIGAHVRPHLLKSGLDIRARGKLV